MFTCAVCGKTFDREPSYMGDICSTECHHKAFWNKALDSEAIIIGGRCYHVEPEDDKSPFRGFGGRPYTIRFKDGRVVKTTNLWTNGVIPKEYHREDNAEFAC